MVEPPQLNPQQVAAFLPAVEPGAYEELLWRTDLDEAPYRPVYEEVEPAPLAEDWGADPAEETVGRVLPPEGTIGGMGDPFLQEVVVDPGCRARLDFTMSVAGQPAPRVTPAVPARPGSTPAVGGSRSAAPAAARPSPSPRRDSVSFWFLKGRRVAQD